MINLGQWPTAPDATMLTNLFAAAKAGTFGPIDLDHLHATGISSGAYMTSRMAFSYEVRWAGDVAHHVVARQGGKIRVLTTCRVLHGQGKFRSLAIESGSFDYCGGPLCAAPLPGGFPKNHPPTLFLQGCGTGQAC